MDKGLETPAGCDEGLPVGPGCGEGWSGLQMLRRTGQGQGRGQGWGEMERKDEAGE